MISVVEVKKIARLSCLELTEAEIEKYTLEFNSILQYFEVLKTADVEDDLVEASIQIPLEGRLDETKNSHVSPEDFSPYLENRFFKVPRVIDSGN
jgi:aspartyl-tRNA(Asn)/glutamyl-tRNA(Gln) amidotransferase subunit C